MNLYELETRLEPEAPHDRAGFTDVVSLYVGKAMLSGNQNRLINYVQPKGGRMTMIEQRFAEPTIRALAVLLDLSNTPHLCSSNYSPPDTTTSTRSNKKQKTDGGDDAKDKGKDKTDTVPPPPKTEYVTEVNEGWTYVAKSDKGEGLRIMNRMEVYLETVYDADEVGVKGWIFHFFIHQIGLSFDDGIGFHADQNAARLRKKGAINEFWQWETDVASWIKFAVSPYSGMAFSTEDANDPMQRDRCRLAYSIPLRDALNPARIDKNFTFETAREHWDSTYCRTQASANSYFDSEHRFIRFPKGARWIPPQMRNPRAILFGLLERPAHALGQVTDKLEALMSMSVAAGKPQDENPDELLAIVAKSFTELVQTPEDRRKPECASRFASWVSSDSAPPGIQACWEFVRYRPNQSFVPTKTAVVDPTLTSFGNAVCWEMLVFEQLFEASYLHTELLFDYINSVGAFRAKRTLRLHTLSLGPPASGKSWKQEMLMKMCATNTWKMVGHQTKRSDTTNTNRDCTLRIMDEANEAMSDKSGDGSGRAELKQILTSGVTYTEQCVVDNELKTRETMEVKSHLLVLLNANSNAEITAFPESMISRLMVRYIPERRRAGMIDPALRDTVVGRNKVAEDEVERHQLRHAMCGLVSHAIDVGWLPEVEMDYAIMLLDDMLERLKKNGVNPDSRSKQRLPLYMRALTIWYAVYMVFQTNTHFEPGTAFKPEHLLECARYLRCSREIVYFAVTHMYDTLINVNAPVVCKAIKVLVEMQEEDKGMHPKRAKTDKRPGADDKDWYILHLPMMGLKDDELISAGVRLITEAIERDDSVVYSQAMVMDTIRWMKSQRATNSNKPSARVTRAKFDEIGLLFSVDMIDGNAVNYVMGAVRASMDDWVRETDKRFVTGITYREGIDPEDELVRRNGAIMHSKRMFPHLFRVIECKTLMKQNKPFVARNPEFREHGFNTLFLGTSESENTEEPYMILGLDLDLKQHDERLAALGFEPDVEVDPRHTSVLSGVYPHTLADVHDSRFEKSKCKMVSVSSPTSSTPKLAPTAKVAADEEEFLFGE